MAGQWLRGRPGTPFCLLQRTPSLTSFCSPTVEKVSWGLLGDTLKRGIVEGHHPSGDYPTCPKFSCQVWRQFMTVIPKGHSRHSKIGNAWLVFSCLVLFCLLGLFSWLLLRPLLLFCPHPPPPPGALLPTANISSGLTACWASCQGISVT